MQEERGKAGLDRDSLRSQEAFDREKEKERQREAAAAAQQRAAQEAARRRAAAKQSYVARNGR